MKEAFGIFFILLFGALVITSFFEIDSSKECSKTIIANTGADIVKLGPLLFLGFIGVVFGFGLLFGIIKPKLKMMARDWAIVGAINTGFILVFIYFVFQAITLCLFMLVDFVLKLVVLAVLSISVSFVWNYLRVRYLGKSRKRKIETF